MTRFFDWHRCVHKERRGEMDRGYKKEVFFWIPCKSKGLRGSFWADCSFGEEKGDRLLSEELEEISFGAGRGLAVDGCRSI